MFKGAYLNGKKNGKGKEYYNNGSLKFEGEYINGIKIEGKGYNENGKVILEINKNGKGKECYNGGLLKFEVEYMNGKRWNWKEYNPEGNIEFQIK